MRNSLRKKERKKEKPKTINDFQKKEWMNRRRKERNWKIENKKLKLLKESKTIAKK